MNLPNLTCLLNSLKNMAMHDHQVNRPDCNATFKDKEGKPRQCDCDAEKHNKEVEKVYKQIMDELFKEK